MNPNEHAWQRLAHWARQVPAEPAAVLPPGFAGRVLARRGLGPPDDRASFESLALRVAVAALLLAGMSLLWGAPPGFGDDGLPGLAIAEVVP